MKRAISAVFAAAALAAVLTVSVLAAPASGNTLVTTHQTKGCHIWALNGAGPAVSQTIKLHPGQTLTIRNNDVMPHQLIKTSGSAVIMRLLAPGVMSTGMMKAPYAAGMMPHMASVLRVSFPKAGTYTLKTKAGEDYTAGVKTVGEDNVLRLKVVIG
jgi:plastocyanin